nr:unnamed protein product [Callosobruchus chinensis]
MIDCIKFCGAFELALREHDESDNSDNVGIFHGLINFSAELDATLSDHLKNSSLFTGTSKEIRNDLLQSMLEVCQEQIIEEINNTPFLAIMADQTTDVDAKSQLAVIFRYLQQRNIDPALARDAIDNFEGRIAEIQNHIDNIICEASDIMCDQPPEIKRERLCDSRFDHRTLALEVCEVILNCAKDRFNFQEHLAVASLFYSENFGLYCGQFPEEKLTSACFYYPTLDQERLRNELTVIYLRNDCRRLNGALPLLKFLMKNHLADTLKETKKLLEIVITIPMITSEVERCFSTLNRIKAFLRNSMTEDCLPALTMLSIEKKLISEIDNFNDKVITNFANQKARRMDLIYKK